MKKLFLPYELAVLAKEKGFDEGCFATYNPEPINSQNVIFQLVTEIPCEDGEEITVIKNTDKSFLPFIAAPLYQQIVDWFRNKEIKICEQKGWGWDIYVKYDNSYILHRQFSELNEAIEEAFKLV